MIFKLNYGFLYFSKELDIFGLAMFHCYLDEVINGLYCVATEGGCYFLTLIRIKSNFSR